MVTNDFTANAVTAINSNRARVWEALVSPAAIKEYMFGADVESLWHEGSDISWKGEFNGKKFEDKGVILKLEPEKILKYSHYNHVAGNHHIITIMLADGADRTEVSLVQENNADEQAQLESEKNWNAILEGLKQYVEAS